MQSEKTTTENEVNNLTSDIQNLNLKLDNAEINQNAYNIKTIQAKLLNEDPVPEIEDVLRIDSVPKSPGAASSLEVESRKQYLEKWMQDSAFSEVETESTYSSYAETTDSEFSEMSTELQLAQIDQKDFVQKIFNGGGAVGVMPSSNQVFGDVTVSNSEKVQIGNVTHITGPVHIMIGGRHTKNIVKNVKKVSLLDETLEETVNPSAFIGNTIEPKVNNGILRILERRTWLAQPPLEKEDLQTPVDYVIISHTATESSTVQSENVYMVRNIQTFHIESRKWSDIGYNFLVGGDANVYEGRGWKLVGAHTYGYNKTAIGISFVGCFMTELPTAAAMRTCKLLIAKGVDDGYISPRYKLLGHCQCSAVESPGKMLFEELKTWPHWAETP